MRIKYRTKKVLHFFSLSLKFNIHYQEWNFMWMEKKKKSESHYHLWGFFKKRYFILLVYNLVSSSEFSILFSDIRFFLLANLFLRHFFWMQLFVSVLSWHFLFAPVSAWTLISGGVFLSLLFVRIFIQLLLSRYDAWKLSSNAFFMCIMWPLLERFVDGDFLQTVFSFTWKIFSMRKSSTANI